MKKIVLLTLLIFVFAFAQFAHAGFPPSMKIGPNTDLEVSTVTIGATGSITEETNTMTFDDGDGLPITLQEIRDATGGADTTAIHDDTAGEINAITSKAAPVAADLLLIEDSADSNNKKKIVISGMEAALEGVMDLEDMQGAVTDAQVPNDITITETDPNALLTAGTDNVKDTHIDWGSGVGQVDADDIGDGSTNAIPTLTQESNWDTAYGWGDHSGLYLPIGGGTLTGELVIDETGIEGQPTDAISDCSSFAATGGGIFYDDSEGKWKKCQDNVLSDLDTNSGGATALDDIGDPDGDGTVDQAGYKLTWTSTLNSAGSVWTFTNTTADLTADVSFLDFKYTDDGDANGFFMRGYDNSGNDLKWYIAPDGAFYGGSFNAFKVSGTAGLLRTMEANSTDESYIGIMGPSSISESFSFQWPDAQPAGQIAVRATPAGSGDPNGNKISAITWQYPGQARDPVVGDPDSWTPATADYYGGHLIANATGADAMPAATSGMNGALSVDNSFTFTIDMDATGTEDTAYLNGVSLAQGEAIVLTGPCLCTYEYRAADTWNFWCDANAAEETP